MNDEENLSEVSCIQELGFEAVGSEGLPAKVSVKQQLKLVDVNNEETASDIDEIQWKETTIEFQLDSPKEHFKTDARKVHSSLQELAAEVQVQASSTSPNKFAALVDNLKEVTKAKLLQLFTKLEACRVAYCHEDNQGLLLDLYTDGLVACGTGPCLSTIANAIQQKRIPSVRVPTLLYTMATGHTPDLNTLKTVKVCVC